MRSRTSSATPSPSSAPRAPMPAALSTAMTLTLVMRIIQFAGAVRIGHFVALGVLLIPLIYVNLERPNYVLLRTSAFFDPGNAPEVNYQLNQSRIAVGSGQIFGA